MLTTAEIEQLEARLSMMSEEELLEFELNIMDLVLEKKMNDGFTVFSEVEHGLLN